MSKADHMSFNARQMFAFLPLFKARTNKLYIFRQCTYYLYVCMYLAVGKYVEIGYYYVLHVSSCAVSFQIK
jgi:hypothetical protein